MVRLAVKVSCAVVALLTLLHPAHGQSRYLAATGNDAANGRTPATAWRTLPRLNTFLATLHGSTCVAIHLHGGDLFRGTLSLRNDVVATPATTLRNTPPAASGSATCPLLIDSYGTGQAIVSAADPVAFTCPWTLVAGTTYRRQYTGPTPAKLFVDAPDHESVPLLAVPNDTGAYDPRRTYHFLDMAAGHIHYGLADTTGVSFDAAWVWSGDLSPNGTAQAFRPGNPGPRNVPLGTAAFRPAGDGDPGHPQLTPTFAYPGLWYADTTSQTLFVNLGSDPGPHAFFGTQRDYNVERRSVNWTTVRNLTLLHAGKTADLRWSFSVSNLGGAYATNDHNHSEQLTVANYSGPVEDHLLCQDPAAPAINVEGGIVSVAECANAPGVHSVVDPLARDNHIGMADTLFGRSERSPSGIGFYGIDANSVRPGQNDLVATGNVIATRTASCFNYTQKTDRVLNQGGEIAYTECFDNPSGDFFLGSTAGGWFHHLRAHDGGGAAFQLGGRSTSTPERPQIFEYLVGYNKGKSPNGNLYNILDCNSSGPADHLIVRFSTFRGGWGAAISNEGNNDPPGTGCGAMEFYANAVAQDGRMFATSAANGSNTIYFTLGIPTARWSFNRYKLNSTNDRLLRVSSGRKFSCADYTGSGFHDEHSACVQGSMGWTDPDHGDFTLQPGSPLLKAGPGGTNIGAFGLKTP